MGRENWAGLRKDRLREKGGGDKERKERERTERDERKKKKGDKERRFYKPFGIAVSP